MSITHIIDWQVPSDETARLDALRRAIAYASTCTTITVRYAYEDRLVVGERTYIHQVYHIQLAPDQETMLLDAIANELNPPMPPLRLKLPSLRR